MHTLGAVFQLTFHLHSHSPPLSPMAISGLALVDAGVISADILLSVEVGSSSLLGA